MDHLTKARLEWMFYNEPEYVKEFLDQKRIGELDQILINRLKQALDYMEVLEKSGRSQYEAEAEDIVIELMLAPAEGARSLSDNPPEPLPLEEQEEVYRKLERRQELWNWFIDKYGTPPIKRRFQTNPGRSER